MAATPVTPVPGVSSTIALGGAAQVVVPASPNGGFITNPSLASDQGISTPENLYVDPTGTAAIIGAFGTCFAIPPGGTWEIIPGQTTTTSINGFTTGHRFSVVSYLIASIMLLSALLFGGVSYAQGPGGGAGGGPGPQPNPWQINGPTLNYDLGGVIMPFTVTGGSQGIGTLNISNGYFVAGVRIPQVNLANVFKSVQSVNLNVGALPTPQTGTVIQTSNAAGTITRFEADSYASSVHFSGVRADGTVASPTALIAADEIVSLNAFGYNGVGNVGPFAGFRCYAANTWSSTLHGTYCDVAVSANTASSALTESVRFENDGGLTLPSTVTGGDKGVGTINAAGLFVNGVAVASSGSAITALTGDGTATGPGSAALTLATVNANTGAFGSATQCVTVTNNAKGLTTAISATTCTPAIASITGLGTGVATFLATPSSANMAAMLTTSTGTGLNVFATSPSLLGFPTAPTQSVGDTSTDIATDAFVANAINSQVDMHDPVQATTTAALSFSPTYANGSSGVGATLTATTFGVLLVDGYTPVLNDRLLIKNQASTFQNGCYTVTTLGTLGIDYVLTRCADYNQTSEIVYGSTFAILQGTANTNQQFTMNNNASITVGTTAITYAQTSGGSQLQAGTGIAITGNTVSGTLGSNSSPGIVQCDGSTITCSAGIITSIGSTPVGLVPTAPQGRITLGATAIPTTDQIGIGFHTYMPAPGQYLPITTNGTTFTMTQFFAASQATTDTVKSPAAVAANSIYDIFGWLDSATTTVTIASPAVLSWTANGFLVNSEFSCTTTGAFPTGMSANTPYYVITAGLGANSFEFSTSVGGSAVNTTGSQSGTMTCSTVRATRGPAWASDTNPGTGAGTSQRNFATAFPTNAFAITNGPGANKGTLLGSCRSNGSSLFVDSQLFRWCSNIYNTAHRSMYAGDSSSSWTYNTATSGLFEQAHNSTANQIDFLQSVAGGMLHAATNENSSNSGTGTITVDGIGIGQVTVNNANTCSGQNSPVANAVLPITCSYDGYPGQGRTFAAWLEYSPNTGTSTFYGNGLSPGILLYGISGWIDN
jgi:hypothetical protein